MHRHFQIPHVPPRSSHSVVASVRYKLQPTDGVGQCPRHARQSRTSHTCRRRGEAVRMRRPARSVTRSVPAGSIDLAGEPSASRSKRALGRAIGISSTARPTSGIGAPSIFADDNVRRALVPISAPRDQNELLRPARPNCAHGVPGRAALSEPRWSACATVGC